MPVDEDAGHDAFDAKEIRRIRATYTQSGLYRNDCTATAIWTLPYHDWTHDVYIAPDGKCLVIADDDWDRSNGHVVSFYANGNQLTSYSATDLVSSINLKSVVNWPNGLIGCGGIEFDADALTFTSRTNQGETFVFDVTTGKVIRQWSPFPSIVASVLAAITATAIVFLSSHLIRPTWHKVRSSCSENATRVAT
ncbi:MAG: hypothetical protein ACREHD_22835 [Pirellulales bacterium]